MEECDLPYLDGKHYDAMHQHLEDDIPFYIDSIEKFGEPVLELACGTGRVTIPLAEEGIDVVGLDLSEIMLKRASEKAKEKGTDIKLIKGDMTDFSLDRRFNTILLPVNSMQRLIELEEYESLFSNVYQHLSEKGTFIFEIFNPDFEILTDALNEDSDKESEVIEYENPYGKGNVQVTENTDFDPSSQILDMKWYYYINDELEAVKEWTVKEWNLRILFPKEIDALLRYNGFKVEKKHGDFDRSEFTRDSNTQVIICKKME